MTGLRSAPEKKRKEKAYVLHRGDSARRKERNVTLLDSTLDRLKERSALKKEKRKKRTCCTEEKATG